MTEPEWHHLEAVVDEFVGAGCLRATPFRPSQGGWWCSMQSALDPALSRRLSAIDARLVYDEPSDSITCGHCWASILGARSLDQSRARHRAATD